MSQPTLEDQQKTLAALIESYLYDLADLTTLREKLNMTAEQAAIIPGVRKAAFVALCRSLHEQDGDIEERIEAAKPQLNLMLGFGKMVQDWINE